MIEEISGKLVKSDTEIAVVKSLHFIVILIVFTAYEKSVSGIIPRAEVEPVSVLNKHIAHTWDRVILSHSYHFGTVYITVEFVEDTCFCIEVRS